MKRIAELGDDQSAAEDSELFETLLSVIEQEQSEDDFDIFVRLFRKADGGTIRGHRFPKPVRNLVTWHNQYPNEIYVIRTPENHLELCIDRVALVAQYIDLTTMQNFERCLVTVKPKLMVLKTTHARNAPSKRYGFRDCHLVFGTPRLNPAAKEQKYWNRRPGKLLKVGSN